MNAVTIVMYHYVRPLERSRYPRLKGLDLALFREQLGYVRRHYELITAAELMAAVRRYPGDGSWDLPPNALLLSFDDGYADHFRYVFPLLDELGLQGCFFPPVAAIAARRLLTVNRLHFLLAAVAEPRTLVEEISHQLDVHRARFRLRDARSYYDELAHPSRYDGAEVVFVKRMLQRALPSQLRDELSQQLFAKYVSADEAAFAEELYMSRDQLRQMVRHGMYVGSHGCEHLWLSRLDAAGQAAEIDRALAFLAEIGSATDAWIMCYPHGDFDDKLVSLLRSRGCAAALTTRPAIAIADDDPLKLPRLDTNDLPKRADAPPCRWTRTVAGLA